MSLRDNLIHSEIQHLGQMIQMLSYELTVLQDFMKEKFGSDYDNFRDNSACEQQNSNYSLKKESTSSKPVKATARKSTAPRPQGGLKRERSPENEEASVVAGKRHKDPKGSSDDEDDEIHVKRIGSVGKDPLAYQDADNNDENSQSASEEEGEDEVEMEFPVDEKNVHLLLEEELEENGERVDFSKSTNTKGKPRKEIWNKFIVTKLPNGKLHVKCPMCKQFVSNKSSRMEKHHQNCRLLMAKDGTSLDLKAVANAGPSTSKMSLAEEKRESLKAMRELKKQKLKIASESSSIGGGNLGPGRRLDPVWTYFNVTDHPQTGKKIATCKRCESRVSNKVNRIRRHFIICHELDKEEEEDQRT